LEQSDGELEGTEWELVVVGSGYSGLVNCLTREELPSKTLLVGMPDPWSQYETHPMGQYPALLALPGYDHSLLVDAPQESFLSSELFSKSNTAAYEKLVNSEMVTPVEGELAEPIEKQGDRWLVKLLKVTGETVQFSTQRIDICTGPGPARRFSSTAPRVYGPWSPEIRENFNSELQNELDDCSMQSAFIAHDYLRVASSVGGDVLVVGEGPLAAAAVERALNTTTGMVSWVGRPRDMSAISFPYSGRYDSLIQGAADVRAIAREFEEGGSSQPLDLSRLCDSMRPDNDRLTIGLGKVLKVGRRFVEVSGDRLGVGRMSADECGLLGSGEHLVLPFDRLVISASVENDILAPRSAAAITQLVPKFECAGGWANFKPIVRNNMSVGLESEDGAVRVLGAPSRYLDKLIGEWAIDMPPERAFRAWADTLCGQARMAGYQAGVTIGGYTIGLANDYLSIRVNDCCVNTRPVEDFPDMLSGRSETAAPICNLTGAMASAGLAAYHISE